MKKTQVMNMLYKYKGAFSLRDETGTCPNIEVEIDVTDKFPNCLCSISTRQLELLFWRAGLTAELCT